MRHQDESPPPALRMIHCPDCEERHPEEPFLTPALVAAYTKYSLATIYTYISRGGILPKPVGYRGGNVRFRSCAICRWMTGRLTPDEVQPVRTRKVR